MVPAISECLPKGLLTVPSAIPWWQFTHLPFLVVNQVTRWTNSIDDDLAQLVCCPTLEFRTWCVGSKWPTSYWCKDKTEGSHTGVYLLVSMSLMSSRCATLASVWADATPLCDKFSWERPANSKISRTRAAAEVKLSRNEKLDKFPISKGTENKDHGLREGAIAKKILVIGFGGYQVRRKHFQFHSVALDSHQQILQCIQEFLW